MKHRLALLLGVVATLAIAGEVYKWVDEQGRTHDGESPPPGRPAKPLTLPAEPPKQQQEQARQALDQQLADRARREQQQAERARREQPQDVLGTLVLALSTAAGATVPQPPFSVARVVQAESDGREERLGLGDPAPLWNAEPGAVATTHHNFALSLRPGDYRVRAIELSAQSLGGRPIVLQGGRLRFGVPDARRTDLGRIAFKLHRLPPLPIEKVKEIAAAAERNSGRSAPFACVDGGALLDLGFVVDSPEDSPRASAHDREPLARARAQGCSIAGPRL